jgi:peptidoglycan/LPS O-acetylase OafA/YrhL
MKKLYFPGLNLLRFYAALSVVISHTNYFNEVHPVIPGWLSGWDAVTLFFTLSGFLITYLLLVEREKTSQINVKAFYMRRALRIWPVYYFSIFVAVVLMGDNFRSLKDGILILVFLPNITANTPLLAHLWSIGTEEQFYLVYPQLFRRVGLVKLCLTIIIGRWIITSIGSWASSDLLYYFLLWNRFDAMAVGALFAYAVYHRSPKLQWFYRGAPLVALLFALAMFFPSVLFISRLYDTSFAIVCGAVIVNIIRFPALERNWTRWVGNISYGIYMYHMLVIYMLPAGTVNHITVIALTVLVASMSYQFLEKPFLNLKKRWSPDLVAA